MKESKSDRGQEKTLGRPNLPQRMPVPGRSKPYVSMSTCLRCTLVPDGAYQAHHRQILRLPAEGCGAAFRLNWRVPLDGAYPGLTIGIPSSRLGFTFAGTEIVSLTQRPRQAVARSSRNQLKQLHFLQPTASRIFHAMTSTTPSPSTVRIEGYPRSYPKPIGISS